MRCTYRQNGVARFLMYGHTQVGYVFHVCNVPYGHSVLDQYDVERFHVWVSMVSCRERGVPIGRTV